MKEVLMCSLMPVKYSLGDALIGYYPLAIGIFVSVISLNFFYTLAEVKWPDYYFSCSEKIDYYVSVTPSRFIYFRFIPIMFAIIPVLGVLTKMGFSLKEILISGLLIGFIHIFSTNGKALYKIWSNSRSVSIYFNKPTQIATHLFIIIFCILISLLSAYIATTEFGKKIAPDLEGVRDNFWSSILVLILGVLAYKKYNHDIDTDAIFEKSAREIKPKLKSFLVKKCQEYNANYNLALAICIAEIIQRPNWLRTFEHLKSYFYGPGTYGIMQTKSDKWITDEESIDLAIKLHLKNSASFNEKRISTIINNYNSNEGFQDWVMRAYSYLTPQTSYERSDSDNTDSG